MPSPFFEAGWLFYFFLLFIQNKNVYIKKSTLIQQMLVSKMLNASYGIYLDSASYMDDLQLSNLEIHDSNQKQSLKRDDSETQSLSSFQTKVDILKQLGLSQAIIDSTMESMEDPINHQCIIYYAQENIEQLVESVPQATCLVVLQLCFEEGRARELETYLVKNSLLKHQSLQYWMCLYIDYVNDQVNNKQKVENNGTKQGEWWSSNARTSRTGTRKIDCINLGSENVDSFVRGDAKLRLLVESQNHWFHGTSQRNAENIRQKGIILGEGRRNQDFSHGQGFYLNSNFADAKDWGLKKCRVASPFNIVGAVLIFNFSRYSFTGVELFNNKKKWGSVVKYFRSGKTYDILEDLEKELEEADYIIGEIAEAKPHGEDFESWIPTAFNGSSQLCITANRMAKNISQTLEGIIYLTP